MDWYRQWRRELRELGLPPNTPLSLYWVMDGHAIPIFKGKKNKDESSKILNVLSEEMEITKKTQ